MTNAALLNADLILYRAMESLRIGYKYHQRMSAWRKLMHARNYLRSQNPRLWESYE